jgi:spore coat protein A
MYYCLQYFFRLLDGSDTRFYNLSIVNDATSAVLPMTVVMRDGGYIRSAVSLYCIVVVIISCWIFPLTMFIVLQATVQFVFISIGQRIGVLVDFSSQAPGSTFTLSNSANAPFPNGNAVNKLPQLMRFTVGNAAGFAPKQLPAILLPSLTNFPTYTQPATPIHTLTLDVVGQGTEVPGVTMVNGQASYCFPPSNSLLVVLT